MYVCIFKHLKVIERTVSSHGTLHSVLGLSVGCSVHACEGGGGQSVAVDQGRGAEERVERDSPRFDALGTS